MKTYDSSVKLNVLKMDLDSSYSKQNLSDEQIIDRRWKKTEKALKMAFPLIRRIYYQLFDEIRGMLKEIEYDYSKLNKKVPDRIRRMIEKKEKTWRKNASGYFLYLLKTHGWTYREIMNLLLFGLYFEKFSQIKAISEDVFTVSAVDAYEQSIADREEPKPKLLTMAAILSMAIMPVIGNSYSEYLEVVMMSQVEEMNAFINIHFMQNIEIKDDETKIIIKQANRILLVNEDKYSGGLDDASRAVNNTAYTYGTEEKEDLKVRFVAVIDERTTKMCRSLQDQIFYVNKPNTFERYSDAAGGVIKVTCNGLVAGLNLPPINDHFHWCRSTITYQV